MSFKVLVSNDAENDLDEAFLWYESQMEGLGEKFIHNIDKGFEFIRSHPKASSIVFPNAIKRHIIKNFPFGIYYIIDEKLIHVK